MYLSIAFCEPGGAWKVYRKIAGPYTYAGAEPSLFSLMIDKRERVILSVAATTTRTEILISDDRGRSWSKETLETRGARRGAAAEGGDSLAPKVFQTADGGYLLFIERSVGTAITLFYARSEDGRSWTPFRSFITEPAMRLNFLPAHLALDGADYLVFQSFVTGEDNRATFQLYLKSSVDGGRTWTEARRLTGFMDPYSNTTASPDLFNNERPQLCAADGGIFMVWERRYGSDSPSIYGAFFEKTGELRGKPERINSEAAFCNNPIVFSYKGELRVIWFDNRGGEYGIYAATRTGVVWENREMSHSKNPSIFARPARVGDDIYVFWQSIEGETSKIYVISPDRSIESPRVTPLNFSSGARVAGDLARVSWNIPYDSSGIEGFSWSWSRDPQIEPPASRMLWTDTTALEESADEDGPWYFKVRALDFAGNWSASAGVVFVRDRTPPAAVVMHPPRVDAAGFLLSNTFTIHWTPPADADLEGYYWTIEYLGPAGPATAVPASAALAAPPSAVRFTGLEPRAHYENRDNGLWRLIVYPIDDIGNVGEGRPLYFKLNKYVPHTYITYVDFEQELMGDLDLTLIGRGFAENGNVRRVYFGREDEAGFDRTLALEAGDFRVEGDREIVLRRVENLAAGNYYVYVEHPLRGIARSPHTITVGRSLTYKFGDFTRFWEVSWQTLFPRGWTLDIWTVVFALMMVFCAALFAFTLKGAAITAMESRALRGETRALLYGNEMPMAKKQKLIALKRRGAGLRLKISLFTGALATLVVLMVSTPLYVVMGAKERAMLMQSLWDRSAVLLDSLAAGSRTFLPLGEDGRPNMLELGFLPAQSAALPEANYVTITGFSARPSLTPDYVWATNDEAIASKINTKSLELGVSRVEDAVSERINALQEELNDRAREGAGALAESVAELNREAVRLLAEDSDTARARVERIQASAAELNARIAASFAEVGAALYSEPAFDVNARTILDTNYTLFKPVIFRQGGSDIYVRGWIRLEISSSRIVRSIAEGERAILTLIFFIALAAVLLGGALSFILATFIILPIRSLVRHVEMIRDTEDKTRLAGISIAKKSSDEIGVLSETINEMTERLVQAALASEDLSIGKEIQKKFIPLDLDTRGNKLTTGYKDTPLAEFFGYYEGAKGVSGDYFDYRDLDGRYYAIIKCDVAGKGIPAALIMVQVATMFINFFRAWRPGKALIEELVYEINAFIEELGFKGRFAAFTLCLFDSETGLVRFCNAGDNLVHYYDASEQRLKVLALPPTPATGVLPNDMVKMKGGYKTQTLTLDHGDILLLYTDGIEEAKRKFRDADFAEIVCEHDGAARDTPHENHLVGQDGEELGADRVETIVNSLMRRESYELFKYHNPHGDLGYHFDFTSCSGSVEELIMAMVSVEKIFRLWKNPRASGSKVLVDRKIDAFLREHFDEYREYCTETQEYAENPEYLYYLDINEDEQYDDLTILGVCRK